MFSLTTTRAAGQGDNAAELEAPALRFLSLAGERALGLDTVAALASFERALALTPPGHSDRPAALARYGKASYQAGRTAEAKAALEEAITAFTADGDQAAAARAMATLGQALYYAADPRWAELPAEAVALLEPLPPGPELVGALTELARAEGLTGSSDAAARHAEQALALAEQLGLPRPARTVGYLGLARCDLGDSAGLVDYREALAIATEAGQGHEAAVIYANLGETLSLFEGPVAALDLLRQGIAFAQARGVTSLVKYITPSTLDPLFDCGELDEALELAASIADRLEEGTDQLTLAITRAARTRIAAFRGQVGRETDSLDWLESTSRGAGAPEYAVIGLVSSSLARAVLGQHEASAALLAEVESIPGARAVQTYTTYLPTMVRAALTVASPELALRIGDRVELRNPLASHALITVRAAHAAARDEHEAAADDYAQAAERWQQFGVLPEYAYALLGQGRALIALGRATEAAQPLGRAREIFGGLQAGPALADTDLLLRQTGLLSA